MKNVIYSKASRGGLDFVSMFACSLGEVPDAGGQLRQKVFGDYQLLQLNIHIQIEQIAS